LNDGNGGNPYGMENRRDPLAGASGSYKCEWLTGEQIASAPSTQLTVEYGRGYTEKSLRHMIRFAEAFPDEVIISAPRRELSWTHFKEKTLHDSIRRARERLVVAERETPKGTGMRNKAPATPRRSPKKGPKG
jgi:DUF1016 N-terminal domain